MLENVALTEGSEKKWLPLDTKAPFFLNLQRTFLQIFLIVVEMAEASQGGEEFFQGLDFVKNARVFVSISSPKIPVSNFLQR